MDKYIEFLPNEKHAQKNANRSNDLSAFRDAGYLIQNNEVIIDIDEFPKDKIQKMIQWFHLDHTQVVWTDRGCHLYFKKPEGFSRAWNHVCQLGFKVEMKTSTNTPNGITIKRNGVARIIEHEGERMELPLLFSDRAKYESLVGLSDGDGRNEKLHNHKLKLKNCENWKNILSFINEFVFADKLDDKEFNTIARDEIIKGDKNHLFEFANAMINDLNTKVYAGSIYYFRNGEYIADTDNARLKRIVYQRFPECNTNTVDEIIKQIYYKSELVSDNKSFPIRFKNGILVDGEFLEGEFTDFSPYYINIDYDPEAKQVKIVDDYINQLTSNDEDYKKLLFEALGYPLITSPEKVRQLSKFFFFRGDGANGKGTLLQILKCIYNEKNCTSLSIRQIVDDRFKVTMIGKLANLGDDIEIATITEDQLKVLKNITSADTISTRRLYSESINATFICKLFFTTNSDIKSFEKGYAYRRRVLWLPMFNTVKNPDNQFITKITTPECLQYWVKLIVDGYRRLLTNQKWTESQKVNEYNEAYHEANNYMQEFIRDLDFEMELLGKTISEIKARFEEWDDGDHKFSSQLFKQTVWEEKKAGIGRKWVNGKTMKVLMYSKDTTQDVTPR